MPRTFDEPSDFSGVEDRSINTAALLISNRPFRFPEPDFWDRITTSTIVIAGSDTRGTRGGLVGLVGCGP